MSYQPSSELQRVAEQAIRNACRLAAWRARVAEHEINRRGGLSTSSPTLAVESGAVIYSEQGKEQQA